MNMGDRIKGYEAASEQVLTARLPVVVRLDGNSFSKWTKQMKLDKPFDDRMANWMSAACEALIRYCSGCAIVYTQSDEITLILRNDQTHQTTPFLAGRTQKLASLLASVCSVAFNEAVRNDVPDAPAAHFDARVFVIPPAEINNVFLWRQRDAWKNCVSTFAYYKLGEKFGRGKAFKMLEGLNGNQRQELVFQELGLNCNDIPTKFKRGICVYRVVEEVSIESVMPEEKFLELQAKGRVKAGELVTRGRYVWDFEIPRFDESPDWILDFYFGNEEEE